MVNGKPLNVTQNPLLELGVFANSLQFCYLNPHSQRVMRKGWETRASQGAAKAAPFCLDTEPMEKLAEDRLHDIGWQTSQAKQDSGGGSRKEEMTPRDKVNKDREIHQGRLRTAQHTLAKAVM